MPLISTYHSLYALPTLLQGLDNVLVAKALIHEYRLRKVSTPLALQATTLQSAGTDTSYQTLEWYGDSCCSLVAAIYGYYLQTHVNCSILEANVLKRAIVENKRQYLAAKRSGLVDYIRAGEGVNSKVWLPVSIAEGTGKTHCFRPVGFRIGVKGIADIVESVVGAYVLTNGISRIFPTFSRLGFEFGVPVNVKTLKSLRPPDLPAYSNDAVSEEQVALFEKCTSYRFKNQALFTFAITRPGNWEQIQDPLEHALSRLGGAVYLHLLTEWIYANHPDRQEGWLTEATHFYGHTDTIMETITHSSLSRVIGHIPQNGRKTKELKAQERLTDGRVQAREIDPASSNASHLPPTRHCVSF
ncbi:hypothetical protein QFC19_005482 [Naganishia cerealis]|uniref:Uncharacterized protein n=1 Tax=Naganishia cerealis TaxID=610337 RepID=A0ACC2VNT1_9TREE|nr:hypothetical protein QFC19_005482 [Naganishia cerealis]